MSSRNRKSAPPLRPAREREQEALRPEPARECDPQEEAASEPEPAREREREALHPEPARVDAPNEIPARPSLALCLLGGGITGSMFQIGALAALEHCVAGLDAHRFDAYFGVSSGASVAAALAGGLPVQRLYRALLDPQDVYFPLERRHLLQFDAAEWRRTLTTGWDALRHGGSRLLSRGSTPSPAAVWEQLGRLYDSLPAGVFSLETYERFLADFFARRGVPNHFRHLPRPLRILAYDLDSGDPALFGEGERARVPVSRACIASMAIPPFFSPVRIEGRHYIDAGAVQVQAVELALATRPDVLVVLNPMVPVHTDSVPTGHGPRTSVRDKGTLWVANQAIRIGMRALLKEKLERLRAESKTEIVLIEPDPTDGILFMHNPTSFAARREILEYAYRTTRERAVRWLEERAPQFLARSDSERAPG